MVGASAVEAIGRIVLHPGVHPHGTESASTFDWTFALAVVLFVGSLGGLLYWYYGRQVEAS